MTPLNFRTIARTCTLVESLLGEPVMATGQKSVRRRRLKIVCRALERARQSP
jgi:hypothetical protein